MKNRTNCMHTLFDLGIRNIHEKNFYNRSKALFGTLALKLRPRFARLMNELFQLIMKFSTYCTSINIFTKPLVFVKIDTKTNLNRRWRIIARFEMFEAMFYSFSPKHFVAIINTWTKFDFCCVNAFGSMNFNFENTLAYTCL